MVGAEEKGRVDVKAVHKKHGEKGIVPTMTMQGYQVKREGDEASGAAPEKLPPAKVAEAAKYLKSNPKATPDELAKALKVTTAIAKAIYKYQKAADRAG